MSRQLDAAIAEALGYKVKIEKYSFGEYHVATNKTWDGYCPSCGYDGLWSEREVPDYSTDGNAMLELDSEMRERGWAVFVYRYLELDGFTSIRVEYKKGHEEVSVGGDNELTTRSLAAYEALTGKVWEGERK